MILNEDINDIIKTVSSLLKSRRLIDGATETLKHQIKKQSEFVGALVASMAASLIATIVSLLTLPVASSLIYAVTGKWSEGEFLPFLALPLIMDVLEKEVKRAARGYNSMDKNF